MDELVFMKKVADEASRLKGGIADIREAVWQRIEAKENTGVIAFSGDSDEKRNSWVFRLDIAAAALVVIGGGIAYSAFCGVVSDLYWSGEAYSLFGYF